jgi:hypothetical protein
MMLRTVSVSRITRPSPPEYRDHLCPFALVPAFPDLVAGRDSGGYHGHSSPWGSRPVGDPAVRLRCTYRARRRPPTHPLHPPHWRAPRATEVARSHGSCPGMARRRLQASFPVDAHFHRWGLGFRQSSFDRIVRILRYPALDASRRPPLP